jgi:hypothetical protein
MKFTDGESDQKTAAENPKPAVGMAKGDSISVLTRFLPLKFFLARIQARMNPKTKSIMVTNIETPKDIAKALSMIPPASGCTMKNDWISRTWRRTYISTKTVGTIIIRKKAARTKK